MLACSAVVKGNLHVVLPGKHKHAPEERDIGLVLALSGSGSVVGVCIGIIQVQDLACPEAAVRVVRHLGQEDDAVIAPDSDLLEREVNFNPGLQALVER